ncbi:hypothetical protein [Streptomyces olivaceiscleroticus]|uniref:RNA polymerase sigma factor 70 region 4 type 2 domain-containing protein n=1 Tax=Streptomyces olivaceiscleroticus TaxID=68245 RepID=A0ABN1BM34_9ACTN
MSALSAEECGDLVEALLPDAAGLVCAVREESRDQIAARLGGMSRHELEAMAVILAAMADPERGLREAFEWINFDEYGEPLPWPSRSSKTVRGLVSTAAPRMKGRAGVDEVAVERALHGDPQPLNSAERALGVDRGIRRGMSYDDVAERLQMTRKAVEQAWTRAKERARAEGRYVPKEKVGEITAA